jgi:hypothetical protein
MLSMSLDFGIGPEMIFLILGMTTSIYFAAWEESYTGVLRT